jgi:hypothetical protein
MLLLPLAAPSDADETIIESTCQLSGIRDRTGGSISILRLVGKLFAFILHPEASSNVEEAKSSILESLSHYSRMLPLPYWVEVDSIGGKYAVRCRGKEEQHTYRFFTS